MTAPEEKEAAAGGGEEEVASQREQEERCNWHCTSSLVVAITHLAIVLYQCIFFGLHSLFSFSVGLFHFPHHFLHSGNNSASCVFTDCRWYRFSSWDQFTLPKCATANILRKIKHLIHSESCLFSSHYFPIRVASPHTRKDFWQLAVANGHNRDDWCRLGQHQLNCES